MVKLLLIALLAATPPADPKTDGGMGKPAPKKPRQTSPKSGKDDRVATGAFRQLP